MNFIYIDEGQDFLASLEQCVQNLSQARRLDHAWKWVILSLHSALQGAMVCHLSGTEQRGALTDKSTAKWHEWDEKDRQGKIAYQDDIDEFGLPSKRIKNKKDNLPSDRVANTPALFERLGCSEKRIEGGCGRVISITEKQRKSFNRLHNLRNKFSHFSPKGWSIELCFIKETIYDITEVLCIIVDDDWPFRHMSEKDKERPASKNRKNPFTRH